MLERSDALFDHAPATDRPAGARHPFPEPMVITTLPTLRPVSTYR